jgi:hypothetical protein
MTASMMSLVSVDDVLGFAAGLVARVADVEHGCERHWRSTDRVPDIMGDRKSRRHRRIALVEIARQAAVEAEMRVVIFP